MELEQFAQLGEFLGGIAVIGSLIYVGFQIRQNTVTARRSNARQTAAQNSSALRAMIDHAEVFSGDELLGFSLRPEMEGNVRVRFDLVWALWFQAVEQTFADVRSGFLESEYKEPYSFVLRGILETPGGREYWAERRVWFSRSFQDEVDSLQPAAGS